MKAAVLPCRSQAALTSAIGGCSGRDVDKAVALTGLAYAPASRVAVEPLRQMTPPADRRGARILTAMVSMASVENAMRTTERAATRLSEEQLYEQIRRVGAVGAAVNVKF